MDPNAADLATEDHDLRLGPWDHNLSRTQECDTWTDHATQVLLKRL